MTTVSDSSSISSKLGIDKQDKSTLNESTDFLLTQQLTSSSEFTQNIDDSLEPLENPKFKKYAVLPIQDKVAWEWYKTEQKGFWVDEELNKNLALDKQQWPTLEEGAQRLIKRILAFFAVSDGIVNENIQNHLIERIQIREVQLCYNFQMMIEDVHNTVYSRLIETYINDPQERTELLDSIAHYPTIANKVKWIQKWLGTSPFASFDENVKLNLLKSINGSNLSDEMSLIVEQLKEKRPPLARQIFINAVMEGLFFSGSFCIIFWIFHFYRKLPGLTKANEWISRDEGMHTKFAIFLYNSRIKNRLTNQEAQTIIKEAVQLESEFIQEALPEPLNGMNATLLQQYIKFVADQLLIEMKHPPIYKVDNPFTFMEKQSVSVRSTDFFMDNEASEYQHPSAGTKPEDHVLEFDD